MMTSNYYVSDCEKSTTGKRRHTIYMGRVFHQVNTITTQNGQCTYCTNVKEKDPQDEAIGRRVRYKYTDNTIMCNEEFHYKEYFNLLSQ